MRVSIYHQKDELVVILDPENEMEVLACRQMKKFRADVVVSEKIHPPLQEAQFSAEAASITVDTSTIRAKKAQIV